MNRRSRPRRKGGRRGKKNEIRVGDARWSDVMELSSELIARIEDGDEDEVTQSYIASVSRRVREAARAIRGLENAIESIRTPGAPPIDAPALRIPLGEAAMHYARSPSAYRGTLGASDGPGGSRAGVAFGGMEHYFHNFASSSTSGGGGPGARASGPQGHRVEQSAMSSASAPTGMMLQMPAMGRPPGGYIPQVGSTQYRLSLPPGFGAGSYGIGGPDGTSLQTTPMASTEQSSVRVTLPEGWDSSQGGFPKDDKSPPAQWSGRSFRSDPSPYSIVGYPAGAGGTTGRTACSGGSGSTGRGHLPPPPTNVGLEGNSMEEHAKALAGLSEKAGAGSRRSGPQQYGHSDRIPGGLLPAAPYQLGVHVDVPRKDSVGAPRVPRPSAAAAASSADALQPSDPMDGGPIGLSSASTSHSRQELYAGAWDEGITPRAAGLGGAEQASKGSGTEVESGSSPTGTGGSEQVGGGESSSNTSGNLLGQPVG